VFTSNLTESIPHAIRISAHAKEFDGALAYSASQQLGICITTSQNNQKQHLFCAEN
jgi:hypothetical protein